mgnify:CR=1 FL=1
MLDVTSQITFMYFDDYVNSKNFFENILELEKVYDPEWACVYRVAKDAYVGAVDATKGSVKYSCKGGMLISITVTNIEEVHSMFSKRLSEVTAIKEISSIGLKSFFFKGPEGYDFEIQQFILDDLKELF